MGMCLILLVLDAPIQKIIIINRDNLYSIYAIVFLNFFNLILITITGSFH